ncbi:ubiquitin-specific protease doa4 [Ascosphaera aggregata]|nr:ubiquitin-specific protease doa4 [Ascosphaera aggregata]
MSGLVPTAPDFVPSEPPTSPGQAAPPRTISGLVPTAPDFIPSEPPISPGQGYAPRNPHPQHQPHPLQQQQQQFSPRQSYPSDDAPPASSSSTSAVTSAPFTIFAQGQPQDAVPPSGHSAGIAEHFHIQQQSPKVNSQQQQPQQTSYVTSAQSSATLPPTGPNDYSQDLNHPQQQQQQQQQAFSHTAPPGAPAEAYHVQSQACPQAPPQAGKSQYAYPVSCPNGSTYAPPAVNPAIPAEMPMPPANEISKPSSFTGDPNNAFDNAKFLLREKQHEAAFGQYLEAYEIAVNIIPTHPEYTFTSRTDAGWKGQFGTVLGDIQSMEQTMRDVKRSLDTASPPPSAIPSSARLVSESTIAPTNSANARDQGQRSVSIAMRDTEAEIELTRTTSDSSDKVHQDSFVPGARPLPTPPTSSPGKGVPRKPMGAPSPPRYAPPPPPCPDVAPPLPPPAFSQTNSVAPNQSHSLPQVPEAQLQSLSLSDQNQPPVGPPSSSAAQIAAPDPLALRFAELRSSHNKKTLSSGFFDSLNHNTACKSTSSADGVSLAEAAASELMIPKQRPSSLSASTPTNALVSAALPATDSASSPPAPVTSDSTSQRRPGSKPTPLTTFLDSSSTSIASVLSPAVSNVKPSPAPPPKRPLSVTDLPRSPPSAYSPVVSTFPTSTSNPPKALVESPNRMYTSKSLWPGSPTDETFIESGYHAYAPSSPATRGPGKSEKVGIPAMIVMKPATLVKYMKDYSVLLVDIRERERFDDGHIFSNNVICIEPIELQSNTSADDLEERLIFSPPFEADIFSRRNQFDVVVYYDQSTADASFLTGSPADCAQPHLRAFYDSLYSFSRDKPLKDGRPPVLLAGGLNAWIELMGPQALTVTKTAATNGKTVAHRKSLNATNIELKRNPTINSNSYWEVKKRRLHGYRALSREESMRWAEKVREEELRSITPEDTLPEEGIENGSAGVVSPEARGSNYAHSYDDFFRRFPEPQDIKQQSMVSSPSNLAAGSGYLYGASVTSGTASPVPPPVPQHLAPMPLSRPRPAAPRTSYSGVSDNARVQPPLARQASASRTQVFAASSPIDRLPLPRTGLPNLGNTCYMNSILQCLSGTLPLTRYFVTDQFRELVLDQDQNFHGSHGILPGFYANLIRMLWRADRDYRPLYTLRDFCGRIHPDFRSTRQQDAKEFFDILVDALHEDFNQKWRARQLPELSEEEEARRERMPLTKVSNIEWGCYLHNESSLITFLFAGQHASRLECLTCHNTSTKCEAFYTISVEIPQGGVGHIYDCLNSYCAAERLEWKCKRCGDKTRDSSKRIILTRAPQILVFHFKRFSTNWTGTTKKIHTPINFPLTHLDMTPYMLNNQRPSSGGSTPVGMQSPPSTSSRYSAPGAEANELATTPPYLYNAYAVVRHIGSSPTEGHYIALVKDPRTNMWRRFDDERVTDFRPAPGGKDCVQNEQAYLVFYERVLI